MRVYWHIICNGSITDNIGPPFQAFVGLCAVPPVNHLLIKGQVPLLHVPCSMSPQKTLSPMQFPLHTGSSCPCSSHFLANNCFECGRCSAVRMSTRLCIKGQCSACSSGKGTCQCSQVRTCLLTLCQEPQQQQPVSCLHTTTCQALS